MYETRTILTHKGTGEMLATNQSFVTYRKLYPRDEWLADEVSMMYSRYDIVCYGKQRLASPQLARVMLDRKLPRKGETTEMRSEFGNLGRITMTNVGGLYLIRHYWPETQKHELRYGINEFH